MIIISGIITQIIMITATWPLIQFVLRLDTRWSSPALSDRSGPRRSELFSCFHFSYFQPHNHKCILLIKLCVFKCSVVPLAICDVDSLFSHCADFQSTAKNNYRQSRFKNRQISTNKQEPEATKYLIARLSFSQIKSWVALSFLVVCLFVRPDR